MSRLILLLLLTPSLLLAQHVQKLKVRYDPSVVSEPFALEVAKFAAYKHREETNHKVRIIDIKPFKDNRPDLADWSLREERVGYLYTRFFDWNNYTTTLVLAGPVSQNGKLGSAGAAYECDRHGGIAIGFLVPGISIDQAALIATHELGHVLGSPHSPDWYQDIMNADAQRVYFNKFGGFFRDSYDFEDSDFYSIWFKSCNKIGALTKFARRKVPHICKLTS